MDTRKVGSLSELVLKFSHYFSFGDLGVSFLGHTRNLINSRCYIQKCEFFQQFVKNHTKYDVYNKQTLIP